MVDELNPPTKVVDKFLRMWGERETYRSQYTTQNTSDTTSTTQISPSSDDPNPVDVVLSLSKRLIAVVKMKSILNIEAGLELIALAISISSEVCCHPALECMGYLNFLRTTVFSQK